MIKLAMICSKNLEERQRLAAILKKLLYTILECPDHLSGLYGLTLAPDLVIMHLELNELVPSPQMDCLRELLRALGESQRIFASQEPNGCWQRICALKLPCDGIITPADISALAA
jgi:hypothetical protein